MGLYGNTCINLCLVALLASTAPVLSRRLEEEGSAGAPEGPYHVPAGYTFHDSVQFTEHPNNGMPHMRLHTEEASVASSDEGWHTILITPDGRSYKKALADSLDELALVTAPAMNAARPSEDANMLAQRRRLSQSTLTVVAPPDTSIGVSTSSGDLSCDGCGPDNRQEVSSTTTYPWMTVGQLIGQLGNTNTGLECSGTLIGNRHVATAAHCVFDINESRQYVSSLNFAPALNGNNAPYGTIKWDHVRVVSQFTSQLSYTTTAMNYDFALVTLSQDATSGYLGLFYPPSNQQLETVSLTTAGYPGSKPSGTMWSSNCSNVAIDYSANNAFANVAQCSSGGCSNIMTHTCISSDGQSGSGMWDENYQIRAILTGKVTTSDNNAYNVGTEIDTEVYNQLASWYNEDNDDSAGNGTLPLAPSGPGSQPATQNAFVKWWDDNWGKPWFIAIVVIVCVAVALVLFAILVAILRRCCFSSKSAAIKSGPTGYPVQAQAGVPRGSTPRSSRAGLPPLPRQNPQPFRQDGVTYDGSSGQFLVNGRPYGAPYQHGRTPSATPFLPR